MPKLFWPKDYWLNVFFSNRYVYAQVALKREGRIVASASTIERDVREALSETSTSDKTACAIVGKRLAERCKTQEIPKLHYEFKEGQRYHGKLKTVIDALMQNGVTILRYKTDRV